MKLIATTSFGLESFTAGELKKLGYTDQKVENGRVSFKGDMDAIARSNIWLRTSERVLIEIGAFKALSFDELFENTRALPWEEWILPGAGFPVTGRSLNSALYSVPDCQSIVKKAIAERLKSKYNQEWLDENGPQYKVEVGLLNDVASLTIDTSGLGLHKRGYRKLVAQAPLKETLACALIQSSFWKWDRVLHDPFCGSGTIPIEAAMIAKNIAPGLQRTFIAQTWDNLPKNVWNDAKQEAYSLIEQDREIKIIGTDIDNSMLTMSRHHAEEAGVDECIHFQRMPMKEIASPNRYGCIICNPPYGERLGEKKEVEKLYRDMGKVFAGLDTWSYYILTSQNRFETLFGKIADKKRKVYNGRLQCYIYQFYGPKPKRHLEQINGI